MGIPEGPEISAALGSLVERYRDRCLWFFREDFTPVTVEQALLALDQIEKHGDREGFIEARRLRQWLQRVSSASSAG